MKRQHPSRLRHGLRLAAHTALCLLMLGTTPQISHALTQEQKNVFKNNNNYFNVDIGPVCGAESAATTNVPMDAKQEEYAKIIMGVAKTMNMGRPGALVAIITVIQESHFKNYANKKIPPSLQIPHDDVGNDGTSLGIFQQQLNTGGDSGWSTISNNLNDKAAAQQLMTPAYGAEAFFGAPNGMDAPKALTQGLQRVDGWEKMDPADAAQAVQKSAYPDAYAAHVDEANGILDKYWEAAPAVDLPVPLNGNGQGAGNNNTAACSTAQDGDVMATIKSYAWPTYHPPNYPTKKAEYKAAVKEACEKGEYVGYQSGGCEGTYTGVDCGGFVTLVMRNSGADPTYNENKGNTGEQLQYAKRHTEKYTEVPVSSINDLQPGDIAIRDGHTYLYTGKAGFPGYNAASASVSFKGTSWRAPMASNASDYRRYEWFRLKR